MKSYEIADAWVDRGTRKNAPTWIATIFFIILASGTAFADVFNEQGERFGSTFDEAIESARATSQAKADAYREQTRLQAEATMAAAAIPQTSRPLTNAEYEAHNAKFDLGNQTAAEAGRIAFIAKGDFSPEAAIEYAKSTGMPFTVGAKPMTVAPTVAHNPVTLNGTPVGLSGFSEPTPSTPTIQSSGLNGVAAKQSAEAVKVKVVKAPEPVKAKTLVSLESKRTDEK